MRKLVWTVEADANNRTAIGSLIEQMGYKIDREFSEAFLTIQALLTGDVPDLMIISVDLPDASGIELLEFIRRRALWNSLPIILFSEEERQMTYMAEKGADGCILESTAFNALQEAIELAIRKRAIVLE
jgi:DNA-binding NarL/FixJ family response regulator